MPTESLSMSKWNKEGLSIHEVHTYIRTYVHTTADGKERERERERERGGEKGSGVVCILYFQCHTTTALTPLDTKVQSTATHHVDPHKYCFIPSLPHARIHYIRTVPYTDLKHKRQGPEPSQRVLSAQSARGRPAVGTLG